MNDLYHPYCLTGNPFPADASLNMDHPERQYNGSIFSEKVCEDALKELDRRLRRRTNLIYCQDTSEFMRGVGKSAIIAHIYRKLSDKGEGVTSTYIRAQKSQKPTLLCARVIREWHQQGFLWKTLAHCLRRYVEAVPSPEIRPDGAELLMERAWPINRVDLRAYLCYNPSRLIHSLTDWACAERNAISLDVAAAFFESYLSRPRDFLATYPKALRKLKWDEIDMLRNMLELLHLGGFQYHYLFCDQFEDPIYGLRGRDLIVFSSEMRRLLEAGVGRMSIIVTLNSSTANTLEAPEGQELTTLAPLDRRHVVFLEPLEPRNAEVLAITYLREFRTETPSDPLFPLTSEAVNLIHDASEGVIRDILTGFNLCIEEGIDVDYPPITSEFLHSRHEEIIGRISPQRISLG